MNVFPICFPISTPVVFSSHLSNDDPKFRALEYAQDFGVITGKDMINLNSYANAIFAGVQMSEKLTNKGRLLNERIFIFDMMCECYLSSERERLFDNALKSLFGGAKYGGSYSFANFHFAGENDPNPHLHSFEFYAESLQDFGFLQDGWHKMTFGIVANKDEQGELTHSLVINKA